MKLKSRKRLRLEALESRWCPAVTVFFNDPAFPGDVYITGSVNGGTTLTIDGTNDPVDTISVTPVAMVTYYDVTAGMPVAGPATIAGKLYVGDDPNTLGAESITFNGAGNITLELDLNGNTLEGDVDIRVGNPVNPADGAVVRLRDGTINSANPSVPAQVTIVTGTGSDTVRIGHNTAVTINGNLTVDMGTNASTDRVLFLNGSDVAGNVTITNATRLELGNGSDSTIEGNLLFNSGGKNVAGTIAFTGGSDVLGNATIVTGSNADDLTLDAGSTIQGSAGINLGHGLNTVTVNSGAGVYGNLALTTGNQRDVINFNAGSFVLGSCTISLGSAGSTAATGNALTLNGNFMGSTLRVNGGGGADVVTFGSSATAIGAYFQVFLGSGNDTFTLNSNAIARGYFDGGYGRDRFISTVLLNFPVRLLSF